jgi:hypothetical protein
LEAWCVPAAAGEEGAMDILPDDGLLQGAELALQAYTRASDAYALSLVAPSVALWTLAIAAAVVLLEWLLGRGGPR